MSREAKIFLAASSMALVASIAYLSNARAEVALRNILESGTSFNSQNIDAETEALLQMNDGDSLQALERDIIETDLRDLDREFFRIEQ